MDVDLGSLDMQRDSGEEMDGSTDSRKRLKKEEKKRFECTFPGCGRSYSRAEHLYRHQLNHNPKEIFRCNFPGCSRTFVRQDLCVRHQERHTDREKQSANSAAPRRAARTNSSQSPQAGDFQSSKAAEYLSSNSTLCARRPSDDLGTLPADTAKIIQHPASSGHDQTKSAHGNVTSREFIASPGAPESRAEFMQSFSQQNRGFTPGNTISRPSTVGQVDVGSRNGPYSVPAFGDTTFSDSPLSVRDEFTNWLFEDFATLPTAFPMSGQGAVGLAGAADSFGNQIFANYFADPALDNSFPGLVQQRYSEADLSVRDLGISSNLLSPSKRQVLLDLMEYRFAEGGNPTISDLRDELFRGDRDSDDHLLSMRSMQHYIGSYWYHFHTQLPILHQPTFSAEHAHNYLLLAVMAIGASYLNRVHGRLITEGASKLATFIAWHLRWQVFMDSDFRPPAKLWVFQTLLLLEVYEKMNATRALHERAHIHYPTTITLMRRGTALIDNPQNESSHQQSTPEQWWSRWITAEATRRAAFAAFFIDALHATIFGHAAMMVVHEVRLPLPCDDALWSATSAAEVGRVEASLHANGIRPTTFLDGLKKTLTGRKVRTNTFGRMILVSGLLSVSWHMQQRDLQISSLGISHGMGIPEGWKQPLTKAIDFWKKDMDESLAHMRLAVLPWQNTETEIDDSDPSITASVLHHLSHIAMHVDIMDCQIFAGAKLLHGRTITDTDKERVRSRMHGWVKTPGSRMAVYHALQVLKEVLLAPGDFAASQYNARDDNHLFRPWAMYISGLVIWSWGFATDGALRPFPSHLLDAASPGEVLTATTTTLSSSFNQPHMALGHELFEQRREAILKDAQSFLRTIGAAKSPQELDNIKTGRNNVVGLLRVLEIAFEDSRWELLPEAGARLRTAVDILER